MSEQPAVDSTDLAILDLLQSDGRLSNAEVARRLGLATSTVFERVRKLEQRGVIRGFQARVDPKAVGYGVTAFVFVEAADVAREDEVERALLAMPEVLELHKIAGADAFLAKVRASDNESLGSRLREGVESAGARSIRTTIVLATAREESRLDLSHLRAG
ncbi:MAG: Lrp/AsnC family transcriptional regulator [Gemmatimonadales bacterium]